MNSLIFSDNSYLEPPSYADVIFSPFGPSSENGGFGEESINGGIVRMEHLISPNPFLISLMTRSSSTVLPPVHLFQLVIAAKLILLQVRMSTCWCALRNLALRMYTSTIRRSSGLFTITCLRYSFANNCKYVQCNWSREQQLELISLPGKFNLKMGFLLYRLEIFSLIISWDTNLCLLHADTVSYRHLHL